MRSLQGRGLHREAPEHEDSGEPLDDEALSGCGDSLCSSWVAVGGFAREGSGRVTTYQLDREGAPTLTIVSRGGFLRMVQGGPAELSMALLSEHLALPASERSPWAEVDGIEMSKPQTRAWRLLEGFQAAVFSTAPGGFTMTCEELRHVLAQLGCCWVKGDLVWMPTRSGWTPGHVSRRAGGGKFRAVTICEQTAVELVGTFGAELLRHRDKRKRGDDHPGKTLKLRHWPQLRETNTTSGRIARGATKR